MAFCARLPRSWIRALWRTPAHHLVSAVFWYYQAVQHCPALSFPLIPSHYYWVFSIMGIRLLQFYDNGEYCLTHFPSDHKPFYGILSHRWGADGDEITYEELMDGERRSISERDLARGGFRKLQFCQQRAAQEGLRYFWIDTCCINKRDQSELSYALNSIFYWYRQATRCYVYMSDVSDFPHNESFTNSEWFTRG